jgi:hypothetical protein
MLLLALGCSEEELPAAREPAPPILSASCSPTNNPLRVRCTTTLDAPAEVTLTLQAPGAPTRTFVGGPELLGWGLLPETVYTWTIGPFSGEIATGSLPAALAQADIVTTGESFGFDAVLHPMQCSTGSYFVMIDGQGRIVWYEPSSVYFQGTMNGYEWSQTAHTVLSVGSPDYTPAWGEQEGFARQHNASLHGDSLWLFDNQSQRTSRAVQLQLNPEPGTLRLQGAWSFDDFCEHQGGAIPIEGGVLATCANRGLVWAFHEEDPSPSWTLQAHCDATVGLPLTRAIPVFIP